MPTVPYTKQPKARPALRHKNAIDLRITVRGRDPETSRQALAELRRRVGNLRDAVIPAWELEARGPDPVRWELV